MKISFLTAYVASVPRTKGKNVLIILTQRPLAKFGYEEGGARPTGVRMASSRVFLTQLRGSCSMLSCS